MPEDPRAQLVSAAQRTLASRGVRFRETTWWDPPPEGVTDVNMRTEGEVDLTSGWSRTTTRAPAGGGCAVALDRIGDRLARVPLLGRRLVEDEGGEAVLELLEMRTISDGSRVWSCWDGAWRGPVEPDRPQRPLRALEALLRVDDARGEGSDEHGRRFRWRALDDAEAAPLPLMPRPAVVVWGWAWLDGEGFVRRVLLTRRGLRAKFDNRRATWDLVELVEVDAIVRLEEPAAQPWPGRGS